MGWCSGLGLWTEIVWTGKLIFWLNFGLLYEVIDSISQCTVTAEVQV